MIHFILFDKSSQETTCAQNWFLKTYPKRGQIRTFPDLLSKHVHFKPGDILWFHHDKSITLSPGEILDLKNVYENLLSSKGAVLCTLSAVELPFLLGFESVRSNHRIHDLWRDKTGKHSFRGIWGYRDHPIFSPLSVSFQALINLLHS